MGHRHFIPAAGHDWLLPFYDPLQRLLGADRLFADFAALAGIDNGQRILDVGCGTGNLAILLKQRFPGAHVTGVDPDPGALARARDKAQRAGVAITFDEGYAERLPYPEASFDRVLSTFMFHHLGATEKRAMLEAARRVLDGNGELYLLDFGGSDVRSDGIFARLLHRNETVRDNYGGAIVDMMREAGFVEAEAVYTRALLLGRVTAYEASG